MTDEVKEFDLQNINMIAYFPEENRFQAMDINEIINELEDVRMVDISDGVKVDNVFIMNAGATKEYLSNKTDEPDEKICTEVRFTDPVKGFMHDGIIEIRPKE